ncbi:MAG: 23S rRNA (guanosine(2251)-2'-O)-methyltransferase RlmB [Acidimicrobiia bacterium]|nr:23S rRNA (guanosine(2251)-2'-O)-methyltransferase RlmB [Acidimicrobiia bacterium]
MQTLAGIHPVREALRAGKPLDRVHIVRGSANARLQQIVDLCRAQDIPVRFEDRASLDRLGRGASHQGVVALQAEQRYRALEEILPEARMIVVLDGVEDPHNLGAVIRTAHAAGASAVLIPERRASGITPVAAKAAAGALAHLPVVRETNLNRAIERLKEAGFWIYGLDERGKQTHDQVDYAPRAALVLGAEGKGLHGQVRKHCDVLVRIPMAGEIASLNVSVAAGIALFEWKRRYHQH